MEPHGVTAIFDNEEAAQRAVIRLQEVGFVAKDLHVDAPEETEMAARAEQRAEAHRIRAPRGFVMTNASLLSGILIGVVAGVVVGLIIWGVTTGTTDPPLGRMGFLIAALIGAGAAGSVAGGLIGAYSSFKRRRRQTEERMSEDTVLRVPWTSDDEMRRAEEILLEEGARSTEWIEPPGEQQAM